MISSSLRLGFYKLFTLLPQLVHRAQIYESGISHHFIGVFIIPLIISIDSCRFGAPPSYPPINFIKLPNLPVSNHEFLSMPFTASVEGTSLEVGGDKPPMEHCIYSSTSFFWNTTSVEEGTSLEVGEDKPPKGALNLLFDFLFLEQRSVDRPRLLVLLSKNIH